MSVWSHWARRFGAVCSVLIVGLNPAIAEEGEVRQDWGRLQWGSGGLELHIDRMPQERRVRLPRFRNSFGDMTVAGVSADAWARIAPEVTYWEARLGKDAPQPPFVLAIETVGEPTLALQPVIAKADAGGRIVLPAAFADVHGEMLRFEPQPYKNTIGYWVRTEDWASWRAQSSSAGSYELWVHQGCGKGQGGSAVDFVVGSQRVPYMVKETGHFQNFERRLVGMVALAADEVTAVEVRPQRKAANAIMDIRLIELVPVQP